jgi:transcriptional regulator of acetoin/glycerol metabolism
MAKSTQRRHPQGTDAHNRLIGRPAFGVVRAVAPDLSRRAKARLDLLDWHQAHGEKVTLTARHFGFSRPTVYRWLRRYDRHRVLAQ